MSRSHSRCTLMVLLACGAMVTACSDSAAPPAGPGQPLSIGAAGPADTTTRIPRGVGGQVANPRAQLQAEFRKRPDFEEVCRGLHRGSDRMASLVGCGLSFAEPGRPGFASDQMSDELAAMQAEVDEIVASIDEAWNAGRDVYAVDARTGMTTLPAISGPCAGLLSAALGATALATLDVVVWAGSAYSGLFPAAYAALSHLRVSGPAAALAVLTYMNHCRGGTPDPKLPR
jgi:hypothetical protein